MEPKKITSQNVTGQLGANLIEGIVLRMRYVWRPLLIFDVGIDGDIEIADPVTGAATNCIIRVQAKATAQPFEAEDADSFEYHCSQKDLDYWLRGNAPVILIVCRPDTEEAYWVSIKDYFKDLAAQKAHKVHFDKRRDRFDVSCASKLKELALPRDSGTYFAPLLKRETLILNLLQVASFAPRIWVAETDFRRPKEVWAAFKSIGTKAGSEWILSNKRMISFHNLGEYPFDKICDLGTCEEFNSSEWADTEDDDKRRDFVQLLNRCLYERCYLLGLRYDKERKYFYFPATRNRGPRKVSYQSIRMRASREVFKEYTKKIAPGLRAYCRHSAFVGFFVRLGADWYLEITPTYHFTWDGFHADRFREGRLQGIKRLERNPAVAGQLLMWADFLGRSLGNMFSPEYPFLSLGKLATVDIDVGIPDDVWYQAEEGGEAESLGARDNQLSLLGL